MISLNRISVQFNGEFIFKDISFLANPRDRIGLVGKNGAGKSTMLKVIAQKIEPESGTVTRPSGCSVGYLSQDIKPMGTKTVFEETYGAMTELQALERDINHQTRQLSDRSDYESEAYMQIIHDLHISNDHYAMLGGHTAEAEVEKVLIGLGFLRSDLKRGIQEFSGGWQMRVELAKILVQRPDVLLLDEPTNHLDILSIQWLEDFLKDHSGAVILVSHDRAFLDNITNRTIEITLGSIHDYKVPYSKYIEQRKERKALQMAAYENQQKFIADTEKFIQRFRYKATKATQVQSRVKALNKLDRVQIEEEDNSVMRLRFPPAPRSGKVAVLAENVSKNYGDLTVFKNVDFVLNRGEKVAFVGKNGEGKTTLAKIIVGELDHQGKMELGHNVSLGYYAQDQAESLKKDRTVLQTVDDVARGDIRTRLRDVLGAFLFSGNTVDKKVSVLSGGERARLALAKLLLEPVNLLILDEPTNHLDMHSKDVLKQALLKYDGAMIIVSHDRAFLKGLTQKVYEFNNHGIKEHIGDVYEFLAKTKLKSLDHIGIGSVKKSNGKKNALSQSAKSDYKQRKSAGKEIRKAKRHSEKLETQIADIEKEISDLDEVMLDPARYKKAMLQEDVFVKYQQLQDKLSSCMEEWELAVTRLEELSK